MSGAVLSTHTYDTSVVSDLITRLRDEAERIFETGDPVLEVSLNLLALDGVHFDLAGPESADELSAWVEKAQAALEASSQIQTPDAVRVFLFAESLFDSQADWGHA